MSSTVARSTPRRRRRAPSIRIRTRRHLVVVAIALQAVILAAGWWTTFSLVRAEFAEVIEDRVIAQNTELAERVAALLPTLPGMITFGGPDWEQAQRVIEGLDDLPAGGFACLLDEDGRILCHPDIRDEPGLRNLNLGAEVLEGPRGDVGRGGAGARLAELGADPASGRIEFTPGNTHYVATRTLGESPYRLLVHQPVASLVAAGETSTRVVLAVAACALVGVLGLTAGGLAWLVRGYEGRIEQINRRLQGEIDVAHDIQQGTLPTVLPDLPDFELAGFSEAAEETGGDTWDVVPLPGAARTPGDPDPALLLLADATGHGVGPALSVTQLRAMVRVAARGGEELGRIAELVNAQLHADLPGSRFITAWMGRLDPATGTLEVLSAGQGPVFRYRAATGGITEEPADTWPLGALETLGEVASRSVRLDPGDLLLVPSDGLIEARSPAGEEFGAARLGRTLREAIDAGADGGGILDLLRRRVAEHAPGHLQDDQTALLLRRHPAGGGASPRPEAPRPPRIFDGPGPPK
jgi:serine phosphatase RsbU (regulator of sigma subunit)